MSEAGLADLVGGAPLRDPDTWEAICHNLLQEEHPCSDDIGDHERRQEHRGE